MEDRSGKFRTADVLSLVSVSCMGDGVKRLVDGGEAGEIDDVAAGKPRDGHRAEAVGIAGDPPVRTWVELQCAEIGDRVAETGQRANRAVPYGQFHCPSAAIHLAVENGAGIGDQPVAEAVVRSRTSRVGVRASGDHRSGIGECAGNVPEGVDVTPLWPEIVPVVE